MDSPHFHSTHRNPLQIQAFRKTFCGYLSEYSEKMCFSIIFWYIHSMFIFLLLTQSPTQAYYIVLLNLLKVFFQKLIAKIFPVFLIFYIIPDILSITFLLPSCKYIPPYQSSTSPDPSPTRIRSRSQYACFSGIFSRHIPYRS